MNKSKLIQRLADRTKMPRNEASLITATILQAMTDTLANGDSIEIRGFGSFMIKKYEPYKGRNPKTGKIINVPAKRLPFFKVGKELKERVDR
jgi:integration host factor subunit beta